MTECLLGCWNDDFFSKIVAFYALVEKNNSAQCLLKTRQFKKKTYHSVSIPTHILPFLFCMCFRNFFLLSRMLNLKLHTYGCFYLCSLYASPFMWLLCVVIKSLWILLCVSDTFPVVFCLYSLQTAWRYTNARCSIII